MRTTLAAIFFLLGTLLVPNAGYAADSDKDRSSPKSFVKDSVITAKVKAKLAEEKLSSAVHIRVDTDDKGVVYLSGTAKNRAEVDKAGSIARGVEGVVSVENKIKIAKAPMKASDANKPAEEKSTASTASTSKKESPGEYVDDAVITTKVKAAVLEEPSLKSAEINVETYKGTVQLTGFVRSRADINKAVEIAKGVKGVKSVKNDMILKGTQ